MLLMTYYETISEKRDGQEKEVEEDTDVWDIIF